MDIESTLRCFKDSISSSTTEDPLDHWDRFCEHVQKRFPPEGLSLVLEHLIQTFLKDGRYSNDVRFVKHCIKFASFYSDPMSVYSFLHSNGVGTVTADLYVAWAQQFEQRGLLQEAKNVYLTATENQAKPVDQVLQQYRMFQSRHSTHQAGGSGDVRNPLQESQLLNRRSSDREPARYYKEPGDASHYRTTISRSENVGVVRRPEGSAGPEPVSMYCKEALVCGGSELCFEEVRATRYLIRRKEEDRREFEARQRAVQQDTEEVLRLQRYLKELDSNLTGQPSTTAAPLQRSLLQAHPPSTAPSSGRALPPYSLGVPGRPAAALHPQAPPLQAAQVAPLRAPQAAPLQAPQDALLRDPQAAPLQGPQAAPLQVPQAAPLQGPQAAPLQVPQAAPLRALQTAPLQAPQAAPLNHVVNSSVNHGVNSSVNYAVSFLQGSNGEQNAFALRAAEAQERLDVSQGAAANLSKQTPDTSLGLAQENMSHQTPNTSLCRSHQTPNTSLGRAHQTPNTSLGLGLATPSRAMPSPTVNTREALGVIMDMFQAPTLFQDDPFTSHLQAQQSFEAAYQSTAAVPFAIFQDEDDKENIRRAAAAVENSKRSRALLEIPASKPEKPNESPLELIPDESTMWGARYNPVNSLAACPNSTRDFSLLAHMVSTPFHNKAPFSRDLDQDQENDAGDEENPFMRQLKKLSPILEQSSPEDKSEEKAAGATMRPQGFADQGTIVGEGLALVQASLATCSITDSQHPTAALSFREQTLVQTGGTVTASGSPKSSGPSCPGWDVYRSPEQPPKPACPLAIPQEAVSSNFNVYISPEKTAFDFPMSPRPEQMACKNSELETDEVFMSPCPAQRADCLIQKSMDLPMNPTQDRGHTMDLPMSPAQGRTMDLPMSPAQGRTMDLPMSPAQDRLCTMDVPMSPAQGRERTMDLPMSPDPNMQVDIDVPASPPPGLVAVARWSDPWDEKLIASLLSSLGTPISAHPGFRTWPCKVPNMTVNSTISIGGGSFKVNWLLGQGAFATVYEAIDNNTSEKIILKVQKPAHVWEFYIDTQLNERLPPRVRQLYNIFYSAHVFTNGSVLLGHRHSCGTLLNAVNLYKKLSDKVMPQPLVMYLTVCILHMVEQLHSIGIIHADIKPDNFLLGEKFLENNSFDPDNLDHGLVLVDLGQSIDMTLFPEGTAFTAKVMTSGFQCSEMQSGKPWTFQTDYFGVAGTVYCMLFGTYMEVKQEGGVWTINTTGFRRNPHADLWLELFQTLLNVPDCQPLSCLQSLRQRLSAVLQRDYSRKMPNLKNRLVVQLMESKTLRK